MKARLHDRDVEIIDKYEDGGLRFYVLKIGDTEQTVQIEYVDVDIPYEEVLND